MGKTNKTTKKEYFEKLYELVKENNEVEEDDRKELLDFISKEINLLEKKAEKAQEKKDTDQLKKNIYSIISSELKNINEILEELNDDKVTRSMIVARLTKLTKEGKVVKDEIKDGSRKIVAYRLNEEGANE